MTDPYDYYYDEPPDGDYEASIQQSSIYNRFTGLTWEKRTMKQAKITPKYYCGSREIGHSIAAGHNHPWIEDTEAKAIERARQTLISEPDRECVVIVKTVAIVRRRIEPVIVERIK